MTRGLRYTNMDMLPEKMRQRIAKQVRGRSGSSLRDITNEDLPAGVTLRDDALAAPRRKYRNEPVVVDGIRFDSKKEARYYEQLKIRVAAGEVSYFLRQVPIHLPGGTKYVVDFQVHLANGRVVYVDVKGRETQVFRLKKREVEHQYPITIELA